MEKQLITSGEVCVCPLAAKVEFILRRGETDTVTNAVADSCEKCGKPIEKQTVILDFVKAAKPDWMTDEQFAAVYAKIREKENEHSNQIETDGKPNNQRRF